MPRLPVNRTVLGIDLIDSGSNPGYHLDVAAQKTQELIGAALASRQVMKADAVDWQHTGDGLLAAFPEELLGDIIDATQVLDDLAAEHNRWRKPDIRLRISVGVGPLPGHEGLHRTNVDCARMLDAKVFRQVVSRCAEASPLEFSTGLIISAKAYQDVFSGPYTELVRQRDFGQISFQHKETASTAWIRVPHFEAATLLTFAEAEPAPSTTAASGPAVSAAGGGVVNQVNGTMRDSIQAGEVRGGIHFHGGRGR
ncbi:hypothetical protein [Crossiella sp. NPDC003009]